jgi:hypothetical protein
MKDKIDGTKDSFCEELECVFSQFPKYHMNILLGDFSAEVHRDGILKPTIGKESLREIVNHNLLDIRIKFV